MVLVDGDAAAKETWEYLLLDRHKAVDSLDSDADDRLGADDEPDGDEDDERDVLVVPKEEALRASVDTASAKGREH